MKCKAFDFARDDASNKSKHVASSKQFACKTAALHDSTSSCCRHAVFVVARCARIRRIGIQSWCKNICHWLLGLAVRFSLRVREVPGSIPGAALSLLCCSQQAYVLPQRRSSRWQVPECQSIQDGNLEESMLYFEGVCQKQGVSIRLYSSVGRPCAS